MGIRIKFKRIICILLIAIVLTMGGTFVFWGNINGSLATQNYAFLIGTLDGDYSDNPLDNIPSFVPPEIVNVLTILAQTKDKDIMDTLINAVVNIYQYHSFAQSNQVHLAADANDLFNGQTPNISSGDYIIFTVLTQNDDGVEGREVVIIHISDDYNGLIDSAQSIFDAIEQSWTGVNQVSPLWISGGLYDAFHAPVEYNGQLYLNINDGNRYIPPPQTLSAGTWFVLNPDMQHNPQNSVYPSGYIVKSGLEYFIARTAVWNNSPPESLSWAWDKVEEWNGSLVLAGQVVFSAQDGKPHFWRALRDTSAAPNQDNARLGHWREVNNGWIGRRNDISNKSHYFNHNNYYAGDVIIYGTSANLKYRYYRAKTAVPFNQPPLIASSSGLLELNSEYWERWT